MFELEFNPMSKQLAELRVRRDGPFGLVSGGDYSNPHLPEFRHGLGLRDAPRFEVVQPSCFDDRWDIHPFLDARDVDDDWTPESDMEWQLAEWADGSRAVRGMSVLGMLPAGEYSLVRSHIEVASPERVTMGNELIARPPFVGSMRQEAPFWVSVIGGNPVAAPDLDQPLVGLVVLQNFGSSDDQGIYFFPPARATSAGNAGDPSKELLLVVPRSGELVLNNGALPEAKLKELKMWHDDRAHSFVSWL